MTGQPKTESDESVVERVKSGDIDAYGELVYRYENKLTRYVVYLIHDSDMTADVVQDSFIKAYQNLNKFNPKFKFSSWIYRIAHNEAMNAVKRAKHTIATDDFDMMTEHTYKPNTEDLFDKKILNRDVNICINKLDIKYKEIVQLAFFENMKYEQISDILHIPTSTVGVWLNRAKKKLKTICSQTGVKK